MERTPRGYIDAPHLFPGLEIGDCLLSIQGSVGHACEPRRDLPVLEDYERVEVAIHALGIEGGPAHPSQLGIYDVAILARFPTYHEGVDETYLGLFMTWEEVATLKERLHERTASPAP